MEGQTSRWKAFAWLDDRLGVIGTRIFNFGGFDVVVIWRGVLELDFRLVAWCSSRVGCEALDFRTRWSEVLVFTSFPPTFCIRF